MRAAAANTTSRPTAPPSAIESNGDTLNSSAPIRLEAGRTYPIKLDFFEAGTFAVIRLKWAYPGQAIQVIPTTQLYPVSP